RALHVRSARGVVRPVHRAAAARGVRVRRFADPPPGPAAQEGRAQGSV
ncbi:MAG: GTP-binding protein EngA, partial [uncultured Nocardioidaceae bacterium]